MTAAYVTHPPEGYRWAEDLSHTTQNDLKTIIWLCEEQLIDSISLNERWAVRIMRSTTTTAGSVIVRDLKAGRDIAIGSVIGQYVTVAGIDREGDTQKRQAQAPIRKKIEEVRRLIRWTWYLIGGGALFFIVGLVMAWPVAALLMIPTLFLAGQAVQLAKEQGDAALVHEANTVWGHAIWSALLLWGVIVIFVMLIAAIQ